MIKQMSRQENKIARGSTSSTKSAQLQLYDICFARFEGLAERLTWSTSDDSLTIQETAQHPREVTKDHRGEHHHMSKPGHDRGRVGDAVLPSTKGTRPSTKAGPIRATLEQKPYRGAHGTPGDEHETLGNFDPSGVDIDGFHRAG